ncbi:acetyl-CoA C-acyltransferase [Paraglaciecola aestuariivivens]
MQHAYIYDATRTAFGRHAGVLSSVRPDDLLAHVIKTLVERNAFDLALYEDVIIGNTNQSGEDSRNIARTAGLLAGLPIDTGGITLNRLCGSSLAAVLDASRCIKANEGQLFIAGGVESMSRSPYILPKATHAFARNQQLVDSTLGTRFPHPRINQQFGAHSMPETADNIAKHLGIARQDCDHFALASQSRYAKALQAGFFKDEISPIAVAPSKKHSSILVTEDEQPRPSTTLASLAKLSPLFDGVVTPGNVSGINDGAAAVIIGNQRVGQAAGIAARGKIIAGAIAGVQPSLMGLGPVPAIHKALARAELSLADMDVIEINEAFAVQVLGCLQQLGLDFDDQRVNPNGGAIALGHPLGASGARILLTALNQLEHTAKRYALVTMCIGMGQGIAVVLERVEN